MSLTVEDGSGKADADALASLDFVDTYHASRGNTKWTVVAVDTKEQCIRRASDFVDKRPKSRGRRYLGFRQTKSQNFEWPRVDAVDDDGYTLTDVPPQVQKATAEYALRAFLNGELAPDPNAPVPPMNNASGSTVATEITTGELKSKSVKAGPVETKKEFVAFAEKSDFGGQTVPDYPAADLWLEELMTSGTTTVRA